MGMVTGRIFKSIGKFTGPSAHFLSYIIAIPYTLFGRSFLMGTVISIFLVLVQFFGWMLGKKFGMMKLQ